MDLIGLAELAKSRKVSRKRLLTMLRAVGKNVTYQAEPGGRIFVNVEAIALLAAQETRDLQERLTNVEAELQLVRNDLDDLKAISGARGIE